jgi:hypothetical protein
MNIERKADLLNTGVDKRRTIVVEVLCCAEME